MPDILTTLISPDQIKTRLDELASQIVKDFAGEPLTLIGVLTGGFIVLADLSRALWQQGLHEIDIDFIKTASYVADSAASHLPPKIVVDLNRDLKGKNVLIVEDIADSGRTLRLVQEYLSVGNPKSLKTFALLNKLSKREVAITLDYWGFAVDGWIEGYGLDSLRACPAVMVRKPGNLPDK
jgi:hypoxanthine phosphoribosyltransferase